MTTPDPTPGGGPTPNPAPDDATSTYDAAAAGAGAAGSPAPWPAGDAAPWPADDAAPAAGTPPAGAATPESSWPPTVSWPPAGAPAPAGAASPAPASTGWSGSVPSASSPGVPSMAAGTPPPVPPVGTVPPAGTVPPPGYGPGPSWAPAGAPARRATPSGLVAGVILVVIGGALLLERIVDVNLGGVTWPLWIVVPGLAMLIGSFFIPPRGGVGLAIPGTIITIVGLILWVQEAYNLYATWAYAWALVAPTGPGLGMLLYGLVHRDSELAGDGLRTMLVGLGLFLGFALFFEGVIGLSGAPIANLDQVLPYGIIGLGVLLVALSFFGGGRRTETPRAR